MLHLSYKDNNNGSSIIEVLIAATLFCIMVIGIAKLITSTMNQQQLDVKQELASLVVNNIGERLRVYAHDHCGTASFSGDNNGACYPGGPSTLSPDLTSTTPSPIPPDLTTLCPNCPIELNFHCNPTLHIWNGYVRMIDSSTNNILSSVTPEIMQDACN